MKTKTSLPGSKNACRCTVCATCTHHVFYQQEHFKAPAFNQLYLPQPLNPYLAAAANLPSTRRPSNPCIQIKLFPVFTQAWASHPGLPSQPQMRGHLASAHANNCAAQVPVQAGSNFLDAGGIFAANQYGTQLKLPPTSRDEGKQHPAWVQETHAAQLHSKPWVHHQGLHTTCKPPARNLPASNLSPTIYQHQSGCGSQQPSNPARPTNPAIKTTRYLLGTTTVGHHTQRLAFTAADRRRGMASSVRAASSTCSWASIAAPSVASWSSQ